MWLLKWASCGEFLGCSRGNMVKPWFQAVIMGIELHKIREMLVGISINPWSLRGEKREIWRKILDLLVGCISISFYPPTCLLTFMWFSSTLTESRDKGLIFDDLNTFLENQMFYMHMHLLSWKEKIILRKLH